MAVSHYRSRRRASGSRYKPWRKSRLYYLGDSPTLTGMGKTTRSIKRVRSGKLKDIILRTDIVNVYDPSTKKCHKLKIETVVENKANPNFVRRNILTKGVIIKTEKGNARVTSRPGQEGAINAVLIK